MKPYSESCEQNKAAILQVIQPLLTQSNSLLEIGSGTGQHAVYFSHVMPHIQWQTSERSEMMNQGIEMWLDEYRVDGKLSNLQKPIVLDVQQSTWPEIKVDAVFSANTLHIMHWHDVEKFFAHVPALLNDNGLLIVYGPFNFQGEYTSESNRQFDVWLKNRDANSAIRDFTEVNVLAEAQGLKLLQDYPMPANNRILCWKKG